jgi:hypothetical protein
MLGLLVIRLEESLFLISENFALQNSNKQEASCMKTVIIALMQGDQDPFQRGTVLAYLF